MENKIEQLLKYNLVDMTGEVYGRLTVQSYIGKSKWQCLCSCGNITIVKRKHLIGKKGTKSCGCIPKESKPKSYFQFDLTGQIFNRLTVICFAFKKKLANYWKCKCICGNETFVHTHYLMSGRVKSCGCLRIEIIKNGRYNWNPEITEDERVMRRNFPKYTEWKKQVKIRDNYTCQITNVKGGKLCSHHLDGWNWCKEKRYNLDNGITLCDEVHNLFHNLYGMGDNTKEQFLEFKSRWDSGEWLDYQL